MRLPSTTCGIFLAAMTLMMACGGEEDATEVDSDTPVQIYYEALESGQACLRLTVEPLDGIVTADDSCHGAPVTRVWYIDQSQTKEILTAYFKIKTSTCDEAACVPGNIIEVLTMADDTRTMPLESPLREPIQELVELARESRNEETAETTEADPNEPEAPKVLSLKLIPDAGVDFEAGEVLKDASPLNTDLICYVSSKTLDLQAGAGPTISKQRHLKLMRTPGGTIAKFSNINEIPEELPGELDRDMVHNAEAGMGFIVENNLTHGYTKVLILSATPSAMAIEYQIID